jgi:uncharacterized protein (DUF1697 family)
MFRYAAFLRGVSPMNLKIVDFKRCLESAGYSNITTILSSGNAAFDTSSKSAAVIEGQIEATFTKQLGWQFDRNTQARGRFQRGVKFSSLYLGAPR